MQKSCEPTVRAIIMDFWRKCRHEFEGPLIWVFKKYSPRTNRANSVGFK